MRPFSGLLLLALGACTGIDQPGTAGTLSVESVASTGVYNGGNGEPQSPNVVGSAAATHYGAMAIAHFSPEAATRSVCPLPMAQLPNGFTHLSYAFVPVTPAGVTMSANWAVFNQVRQTRGIKTLIGLGGPAQDGNVSLTPAGATAIVTAARSAQFDGIELQWPESTPNTIAAVAPMVVLLHQAIQADTTAGAPLSLVLNVSAILPNLQQYDLSTLPSLVDTIVVRAYDNHGYWDGALGAEAAFAADYDTETPGDLEQAVNACLNAHFAAAQIILGVAPTGRTWGNVTTPQIAAAASTPGAAQSCSQTPGLMGYAEISQALTNGSDYMRLWDSHTSTPTMYGASEQMWISFEDEESLTMKMGYLRQTGLGGVLVHAPDMDDTIHGSPFITFLLQAL